MFDPRHCNLHKLDRQAEDATGPKGNLIIQDYSNSDLNDLSGYADFIYRKAGSEWNQILIRDPQTKWPKPPELEKMARLEAMIKSEWERREVAVQPPAPTTRVKKTQEPTQKQYAIFYIILQNVGLYSRFDGSEKTKKEMCLEIGERHGISGNKFEQVYNKTKINDGTTKDLRVVLGLLDKPEYQAAKDYAETLLRTAQAKTERK